MIKNVVPIHPLLSNPGNGGKGGCEPGSGGNTVTPGNGGGPNE